MNEGPHDGRPAVFAAPKPTGTVTFLFTDIEGSTKQWEADADAMAAVIAEHDRLLANAVAENHGYVFKMVGDACCAAFDRPEQALAAAVSAQAMLATAPWNISPAVSVRMAIHSGAAQERDGDYFGQPVNRVARLLSAGHGEQILISLASQQLLRDSLPDGISLVSLGEHRLKDLSNPEVIYQVTGTQGPVDFPPLNVLNMKRTNLPVQLTSFVGRTGELGHVIEILRDPDIRLLTVTGPGGTGKTRLALQAGADLVDDFPNGVYVTMLAAAQEPDVMPAIRLSLGAPESASDDFAAIVAHIGNQQLLLILDNFEHLVPTAGGFVRLLTECPNLRVLVTSRVTLRCSGEHVYALPPMSTPDTGDDVDVSSVRESEAVRLFVSRARAARADFRLDDTNAWAIASICTRLDGLPLAIELAAARTRMLAPAEILDRLTVGGTMKVLTGGASGGTSSFRTMLAAIDWSYELLDRCAQLVLTQLSMFREGFTISAAEAVCGDEDCDAFNAIEALLDASLLTTVREGDETRFSMLETIREYAHGRLAATAATEIRHRHAEYYLHAAWTICPLGASLAAGEAVALCKIESANLDLAVDTLLGVEDLDKAAFLCSFMAPHWLARGRRAFGMERLLHIETQARNHRLSNPRKVDLEHAIAVLAFSHADYDEAERRLKEALQVLAETPNASQQAECLRYLGNTHWMRDDPERAEPYFRQSLEVARIAGDRRLETEALTQLGIIAADSGDLETAVVTWRDLASIFQSLGNGRSRAKTLVNIGVALSYLERDAEAVDAFVEAAATFRELDDDMGLAHTLLTLADSRRALGQLERARTDMMQAATTLAASDDRYRISLLLRLAGTLFSDAGLHAQAAETWGAEYAMRIRLDATDEEPDEKNMSRMQRSQASLDDATWQRAWNAGLETDDQTATEVVLRHLAQTLE